MTVIPSRCVICPLSEARLPLAGVLLSTKRFVHRGGPRPAALWAIRSRVRSSRTRPVILSAEHRAPQPGPGHSPCGFWFDAPPLAVAVGLVSSANEGGSKRPLPLRSPETATHATESLTHRGRPFGPSDGQHWTQGCWFASSVHRLPRFRV
jgi:hypothetical protein